MGDQYSFAGDMFRAAISPEEKRLAARVWLTDAIRSAMGSGQDVAPALALLSALEGLDFGQVDPMLKLPAGRGRGATQAAPGSTAVEALGLAAVHVVAGRSPRGALKAIIGNIEDTLQMKPGKLAKLRENLSAERSKPQHLRTKYIGLDGDIENDVARLSPMTDDQIVSELKRVVELLGLQKPQ